MANAGPTKPAPRKRRFVARLNVRLTAEELAEVRATAGSISLSQYVRKRALGHPIIASADMAMVNELRRLGGLLKHVHTESGGAYSEATAAAIMAIRQYIEGMNSP
jgi:hypothetical protein